MVHALIAGADKQLAASATEPLLALLCFGTPSPPAAHSPAAALARITKAQDMRLLYAADITCS